MRSASLTLRIHATTSKQTRGKFEASAGHVVKAREYATHTNRKLSQAHITEQAAARLVEFVSGYTPQGVGVGRIYDRWPDGRASCMRYSKFIGIRCVDMVRTAMLFALLVFGACMIGIGSRLPGTLAVFWPVNALLLGLLLRTPRAATATTWLGCAAGFVGSTLAAGAPLVEALLLNAANLLGVLVGFYTARHVRAADLNLNRTISVAWLSALAVLAAAAAAAVGAVAQVVLFGSSWWTSWLDWFAEELINYMVILPLVLTFPVTALARAVSGRPSAELRMSLHTRGRLIMVPTALLVAALVPSWLMGGYGALTFTMPAMIAAALLGDVFVTAGFIAASTTWSMVLTTHQGLGLTGAVIPVSASTQIGLSLVATGPLVIACAMSERERVLTALRQAMTQDDLTGAYRRREFVRRADLAVSSAAARGEPSSLLMMDLDHFKRLNDTFGHPVGDRALVDFANTVRACMRATDLFTRLGGEEFALLLPGMDGDAATTVAERIRSRQQEYAQQHFGSLGSTVSIGLTCAPASEAGLSELLTLADHALYRAKTTCRNAVIVGPACEPAPVKPAAADRSPTPIAWPIDTHAWR